MPQVFGLDIKGIVAGAIRAGGGLTASVLFSTAAQTSHTVEAAVETRETRDRETATVVTQLRATLVAGTIVPDVVPDVNDYLTVDGTRYILVRLISLDPAGAAYIFEVTAA